jgi:hypothetical protein
MKLRRTWRNTINGAGDICSPLSLCSSSLRLCCLRPLKHGRNGWLAG